MKPFVTVWQVVCVTFLICFSTSCLAASPPGYDDYLTGDWGGYRSKMREAGVEVGLSYTAEPAASLSGGYKTDNTYLHNINAELKIDLERLTGIPRTTFLAKYSSRSGDNLSEEYVVPASAEGGRFVYGEYFNKSQEAFGGQTTKLVNFQFTTRINESVSVDYGRLVMNDLFLRSDLYCNFMNNAICGSPKGVFTPYALNAYPDATAGIHMSVRTASMLDVKFGVFDGGWTEQDKNGWDWDLGENGAALAAELQFYFNRATEGGVNNVVKVGINHHTGDFVNLGDSSIVEGQTSLWMLVDWMLLREEADPAQGLAAFGSLVYNVDDEIAALPLSATLGFIYEGLIPGRDRDKLGLMFTLADHSEYNTYTHDFVEGKERGTEFLLELTYNLVLGHGFQLMPTFQYITNPNGSKDFSDVSVLGLKFSVNL